MENIKLLFQIYFRPAHSMSEILDKGSFVFAAAAVLIVSFAFSATVNSKLNKSYAIPQFNEFYNPVFGDEFTPEMEAAYRKAEADYKQALAQRLKIPVIGDAFFTFFSFSSYFFLPLLTLCVFYIPAVILLMSIFGGAGNFSVVLRRDYSALAVCTLTAWAAAHLPFAFLGILLFSVQLSPVIYFIFWVLSSVLFGVFMIFALRTVFGANDAAAVLIVAFAWLAISLGNFIFGFVSTRLFSPFLFIAAVFAIFFFRGILSGEVRGLGDSFRQRQNFKRFLHNATVNPNDADAHVQLGLIYLQRRQDAQAQAHFEKAFAIDAEEIDANFELGKLARKRSDLQKALDYFSTVVSQNDKHALSEVWREIGATYLEAEMFAEAKDALEKFVERRPVDSEGLYHLGKVYKAQNEPERAREMFEQAIESARNSPDFRRRQLRYWSNLAKKEL